MKSTEKFLKVRACKRQNYIVINEALLCFIHKNGFRTKTTKWIAKNVRSLPIVDNVYDDRSNKIRV